SQRLLPNSDSTGRLPACEVLINNSAIASVIREAKTHLLNNILETSSAEGMILLEKYLFMLYKQGSITKDVALRYAIRRKQMLKLIG
ncbi:MAG: type IV pili twitching motility protein PilT, partial [Candidatus Paceibacterota bacterium]